MRRILVRRVLSSGSIAANVKALAQFFHKNLKQRRMTQAQIIDKYIQRIMVDYPEADKIHIDLLQFVEELRQCNVMCSVCLDCRTYNKKGDEEETKCWNCGESYRAN